MRSLQTTLLFLSFLLLSAVMQSCAEYTIQIRNSKVPVSFTNDIDPDGTTKFFRIERKLTWVLFDTVNTEPFELEKALLQEFPQARGFSNIRIRTEENGADSTIRFFGTLIQYLLVTDRSLVSRRTIIIEGNVIE